jgi:acetyl/propionyl-CoA carboxylase alpha subunit
MLGKLIAHGEDREAARKTLLRVLDQGLFSGPRNNLEFLRHLLDTDDFRNLDFHTSYLDRHLPEVLASLQQKKEALDPELLLAAASLHLLAAQEDRSREGRKIWEELGPWSQLPQFHLAVDQVHYRIPLEAAQGHWQVELGDKPWKLELLNMSRHAGLSSYRARLGQQLCHFQAHSDGAETWIKWEGYLYQVLRLDVLDERYLGPSQGSSESHKYEIHAPLSGRLLEISVNEGELVKENQVLLVIESMKMENKVLAPAPVIIGKIHRSVGEQVHTNQLIITLEPYEPSPDH